MLEITGTSAPDNIRQHPGADATKKVGRALPAFPVRTAVETSECTPKILTRMSAELQRISVRSCCDTLESPRIGKVEQ